MRTLKPSEALKVAYKRMSKATENEKLPGYGICHWLNYNLPPKLEIYIDDVLDGYSYAHGWLYAELFPGKNQYKDPNHYIDWRIDNQEAIYQWRLRWIKQMITHFKSIGE
jgi:hypothetical protein